MLWKSTAFWFVTVYFLALQTSSIAQPAGAQRELSSPVTITLSQWLEVKLAQELLLLPYPYKPSVSISEGPKVRVNFAYQPLMEIPGPAQDAYKQAVLAFMRRNGFAGFSPSDVTLSGAERQTDRTALLSQSFPLTRRKWSELVLSAVLGASTAAEGRRMTGAVLPDGRVNIVLYDAPQSTSAVIIQRVTDRVVQALSEIIPGFSGIDVVWSTATTPVVSSSVQSR
ncbi:MAG: hypothetical protein ACP5R4_03050 [Armatimonadota bacterium]